MSNSPDILEALEKLEQGLKTLERALDHPPDFDGERVYIDSVVTRFKYCVELYWKFLKLILLKMGEESRYPREVLQKSYKAHLINSENLWLDMLDDRNAAAHAYDQSVADRIYYDTQDDYFPVMVTTLKKIKSEHNL